MSDARKKHEQDQKDFAAKDSKRAAQQKRDDDAAAKAIKDAREKPFVGVEIIAGPRDRREVIDMMRGEELSPANIKIGPGVTLRLSKPDPKTGADSTFLSIAMPCGNTFQDTDIPLEDLKCQCGSKAHMIVKWGA